MTPAGQRWRRSTPTKEGWYWYKSEARSHAEILLVLGDESRGCPLFVMQDGQDWLLSRFDGEWQGPLTPNEATA